jgi:hypothetical protein
MSMSAGYLLLGLRLLGMLTFFGTVLALLAAGAVVMIALARHDPRLARRAVLAGGAWLGIYVLLVLAGPVVARERVLGIGDEMSFCGFDCHLHVSVLEVRRDGGVDVTIRARSDAREAREYPSHLRIRVRDLAGREYAPVAGQLARTLGAGESYTERLRFDLPADALEPGLVLTWGDWMDYIVPGPENALVQQRSSISLALADVQS